MPSIASAGRQASPGRGPRPIPPRFRRRAIRIANAVAAGLIVWGVKALGAWLSSLIR